MSRSERSANMRSILVTDFQGGDNVMVFTTLEVEDIKWKLDNAGETYGEIYEVPEKDVQYHIYEPLWLTAKQDNDIRQRVQRVQVIG